MAANPEDFRRTKRCEPSSNCASRAASQKFADFGLAWLMLATQMEERSSREAVPTRRKAAPGSVHLLGYPVLSLSIAANTNEAARKAGLTFAPNGIFDLARMDQNAFRRCSPAL